ncbi:hypothetical protein L5515_014593 [Caenorhabditis briggsae]|uniref:Anaphase-promoting complex subunit 4 WD40 domain-containing protein n=2 Tax=Caenorhabditis briggsae TaxID=6238 RepID=A0AAE9E9L7_CAEBR|nr:hypothetical protein L3Y34_018475 [Caenorhabditis briggsae]UMM18614.1 hypothetical protein L5515_014593 [Caenorhabditis briggsae]
MMRKQEMAEILDRSFATQFPEEHEGILDIQNASANCCKFNRWGSIVAVGCTDGRVFVVDFITKNLSRTFPAHALPVTCLSWSRNGRKLLTSSSDNTIAVFDVLTGTLLHRIRFTSAVTYAQFHPRDDNKAIILQLNYLPTVEQFSPRMQKVLVNETPGSTDETVSAVAYDRKGKYIIAGTGKGRLIIYDSETLRHVAWCKQNTVQQIRQIIVPMKSRFIITNTQDRVIRTYELEDLIHQKGQVVEAKYKVLDMVNKAAWKNVCTDSDGLYVCGASTKAHSLYIWESNTGSLIKILHGNKGEALMDVQWHPTRPIILSVAQGGVSLWTQARVENWSAFAPEFQELEENEKYVEKESEFDMEDEDADEDMTNKNQNDEDDFIDVMNVSPSEYLASSDEEDCDVMKPARNLESGPLWYIPVPPEIDNPETEKKLPDDITQLDDILDPKWVAASKGLDFPQ